MDGVSAITAVGIASFAIDRIVIGLLFCLSFYKRWLRIFPDPAVVQDLAERKNAEKWQKLIYFAFAAIFVSLVVYFGKVRILDPLGVMMWKDANGGGAKGKTLDILDAVITGCVLIGGSDRIAALLNKPKSPETEKAASRPIEITGKLTLEEGGRQKDINRTTGVST